MSYGLYVDAPPPFNCCSLSLSLDHAKAEVMSWHPDEFVSREQVVYAMCDKEALFQWDLADAIKAQLEFVVTGDRLTVSYSSDRFQWDRTYEAVTKRTWDYNGDRHTTQNLLAAVARDLAKTYPIAVPILD